MTTHKIIAGILLIAGLIFGWQGLDAVLLLMQRGSSLNHALMSPPTGLIRLIATAAIILGSGLVLLGVRSGRSVALFGAAMFALLAGLMATAGTDASMWLDDAFRAGGLMIGAILLIVFSRKTSPQ